jgi:hypothetical protein
MSKRPYTKPKISRFQAVIFSDLEWQVSTQEKEFLNLCPFYLVHSEHEIVPIAVRLRIKGDEGFRPWQAVGVVSSPHLHERHHEASLVWLLLGYVPRSVLFDVELLCRNGQGKHCIAKIENLAVSDDQTFELAYFKIPPPPIIFITPKGRAT